MSDEFLQWLREQLDDDAELAVSGETWTAFEETTQGTRRVDVDHSIERVVACTRSWRGLHIARHDPQGVLDDVAAKRDLIDAYERMRDDATACQDTQAATWALALASALRRIAVAYHRRPGYRDEWRP